MVYVNTHISIHVHIQTRYKNWKKTDPNVNSGYLCTVLSQVTLFSSLFLFFYIVNKMNTNHFYDLKHKDYDKSNQITESLVQWSS